MMEHNESLFENPYKNLLYIHRNKNCHTVDITEHTGLKF
jgi:hypothetical protein